MKKITLFSPFFYPEKISTGRYNSFLVEELINAGADVTAVCSHPFYPDWIIEKTDEDLKGSSSIRGGAFLKYPNSTILRRVLLEFWFFFHSLKTLLSSKAKGDIAIAIIPPSLFCLAIYLFLRKFKKTVVIIHDLQSLYAKEKKGLIGKILPGIIKVVEGGLIKKFDQAIFLSESMKEHAVESYKIKESKCLVYYPFFNIKDYGENDDKQLDTIFNQGKKNVVYSRALGEKQNPKLLISFFEILSQNLTDTEFHFPWKLIIGEHSWIGEEVFILNFEKISIGTHCCVSQRAFLCGGNHDYTDPTFRYRNGPITIENGAWVCAQVFVSPNILIERNAVISAGSIVKENIP